MSAKRSAMAAGCAFVTVLWALPLAAADVPGAKPGDETMTCEQIAAELGPYMERIKPSAMAAGQTAQEVEDRGKQHVLEELPAAIALTAAATASLADKTGTASKAVGQAEAIHAQEAWQRVMVQDKPLRDKYAGQIGDLAAQAQQMQSDPRLQRLLQLATEKHCDEDKGDSR
jgi:hypothetical protein